MVTATVATFHVVQMDAQDHKAQTKTTFKGKYILVVDLVKTTLLEITTIHCDITVTFVIFFNSGVPSSTILNLAPYK